MSNKLGMIQRYPNALTTAAFGELEQLIDLQHIQRRFEQGVDFFRETYWTELSSSEGSPIEKILIELASHVKTSSGPIAGLEWWFSVQDANKTPYWLLRPHFDRDDISNDMSDNSQNPVRSSVLFMTDQSYGELVITDQEFVCGEVSPSEPAEMVFVRPQRNLYTVFPGSLLHGVIGRMWRPKQPCPLRVTIAINYWETKPKAGYLKPGYEFTSAPQLDRG